MPEPKDVPGEDKWAEIDRLERTAQRYLDETTHHYPKIYDLPLAHYETVSQRVEMADKGSPQCGAVARIETNLFGDAVASATFDQIVCGRIPGHQGNHVARHQDKLPLRHRWKVACWS